METTVTGEVERGAVAEHTPYYRAEGGELWVGDALTMLRRLPSESVQAIITDPPYNIGKDFGNGVSADRRDDYDEWLTSIWAECGRLATDGAYLIYTNRIAHLPVGMLAVPDPWRFHHVFAWHKPLALAGCWYGIAPHWEPIFVYVKGKPWRPFRSEFVMSDVRQHNVATTRTGHPTEKPIALMRDLVEYACPTDGVVLDCFAGSGTTLVAAQTLGRRYIGIEIGEQWCAVAAKRLAPLPLFAAPPPAAQLRMEVE